MSKLHEQFKYARRSAGINQTKLSNLSGVNRSTIWRFENGKYDIKLSTLEKLFDSIGCRVLIIGKDQ